LKPDAFDETVDITPPFFDKYRSKNDKVKSKKDKKEGLKREAYPALLLIGHQQGYTRPFSNSGCPKTSRFGRGSRIPYAWDPLTLRFSNPPLRNCMALTSPGPKHFGISPTCMGFMKLFDILSHFPIFFTCFLGKKFSLRRP
jgi:hypothetical protein